MLTFTKALWYHTKGLFLCLNPFQTDPSVIIDFQSLKPSEIYHTMTQTVVPRPIAWVLSDHGNQEYNLAPFSYFNAVCSRPPMVSISVGLKKDGSKKDTWRNIEERSHFVVHIPKVEQVAAVLKSAEPLEHGVSEVKHAELELTDFEGSPLPRVRGLPIAFYCEKHDIIPLGDGPQGLVLGVIRRLYLDDHVAKSQDHSPVPVVSTDALNPLGRLGATQFARIQSFEPDSGASS